MSPSRNERHSDFISSYDVFPGVLTNTPSDDAVTIDPPSFIKEKAFAQPDDWSTIFGVGM